jgi:NAD(P)H-hydrate epimerase
VFELPLPLYSCEDVKTLDRLALEKYHLTPYQLMCRAGQAAWNNLTQIWPHATRIIILCGKGNNGGDGFVLARLAKAQACVVILYQVGEVDESTLPPTALQARKDWLASGGEITQFTGQLLQGDVIVDALLGTGTHLPLAADFQNAIASINQSKCPVLSLDLPSGLDADTGIFYEAVVAATATITFVGMKIGLLVGMAVEVVGDLYFDNLGVSLNEQSLTPKGWRIEYQECIKKLPRLQLTSHKGNRGHVLIVGAGLINYSGAVCLSGEAALRSGAGLVSIVSAVESMPLLTRAPAELMCYGFKKPKEMAALLEKASCIVVGPGLAQTAWSKKFFAAAIATNKPLVVDADGLYWLAKYPRRKENWILTPHPGEAARLLDTSTASIQADRIGAAKKLREKFGGVVVLKGAGTIVIDEGDKICINAGGFPGLSTAGTGDVLSGLIGALVAQGLSLSDSACLGTSVHTNAAQLEQSMGARGMIASDLFLHIRSLINPFER